MALDLARIRGLCFDLDGTLSDTDDRLVDRFSRRIAPFQRFLFGRTPQQLARRFVMGIETPANFFLGLTDRLGFDEPLDSLVEALNRRRTQRLPDAFWCVPGVAETLSALRPYFPMSVVSARDESSSLAFLQQFELVGFFTAIATAHTCLHTKPYPDPVLWAADRMGLAPAQCLMIGDTVVDIRAGKAAGAQTVGVLCGFGEEPELRRAGADLILPSTALLTGVLLPGARAETRDLRLEIS